MDFELPKPKPSLETQSALVDLWLSSESNEAKLILKAFKIGVEEGKRQQREDPKAEPASPPIPLSPISPLIPGSPDDF